MNIQDVKKPFIFSAYIIGQESLATQCSEVLLAKGHKILGIVSSSLAIAAWAKKNNILWIDMSGNWQKILLEKEFDYLLSIANTHVLSSEIYQKPRFFTVNYHDALLPRYAALNSTSWAILNDEKEHGITWHIVSDAEMKGDLLKQTKITIEKDETALDLNLKCYQAALSVFETLVDELSNQTYVALPQDLNQRTPMALKPKGNGLINWQQSSDDLDRLYRALALGDYTNRLAVMKVQIGDKFYIVEKMHKTDMISSQKHGTIVNYKDESLQIATQTNDICITVLKDLEGNVCSFQTILNESVLQLGSQLPILDEPFCSKYENLSISLSNEESFWVNALTEFKPATLPFVSIENLISYEPVKVMHFEVPSAFLQMLQQQFSGESIETVLFSILLIYLYRIGNRESLGVAVHWSATETFSDKLANLVALVLPFMLSFNDDSNFDQVLAQVKKQREILLEHKTYLKDVIARYPEAKKSYQKPTIGVIFGEPSSNRNITICEQPIIINISQKTLSIYCEKNLLSNNLKHFIQNGANHLQTLIEAVIETPKMAISHLPLLNITEQHRLTVEWNETSTNYPRNKTVHQLFEEQVEKNPEHIALEFEESSVTYRVLNERANQLAHYLYRLGIKIEDRVGLCFNRGFDMAVTILAILKTGATYIPLDPEYPQERIHYILKDSQPDLVITKQSFCEHFTEINFPSKKIVLIDTISFVAGQSVENLAVRPKLTQLMYILYTSGSTGKPKGVLIEHHSVVNLLFAMMAEIQLTEKDRWLAVTSLMFDISGLELYLPLLVGACCVIASHEKIVDGLALKMMLEQQKISILQATPMTWQLLLEAGWSGSSSFKALCGGEALQKSLAMQISSQVKQLWNLYGPTETTIWSTVHNLSFLELQSSVLSIGKPIANTQVYVLDHHQQLVPFGVSGELYIAGEGVARGYLNQPDITQKKFIFHAFSSSSIPQRLYKTGDQVRWLANGQLEYVGRNDEQIKINGFRIEPAEIEAILEKHPSIKQAIVVAYKAPTHENRLAAYVISDSHNKAARMDYSLFYFASSNSYHQDTKNPYALYLESVKYADQAGFKAVWTPERHFHKVGGCFPNPATLSAALATITKQIELRAGSVVLPLHNPLRVAEEWSVVDNLSGGRVGIGFASGWNPKDFAFFPENYPNRKECMRRDIERIKALWRDDFVKVTDGLGKATNVKVFPKPLQKELPIWITAAGSPNTFIEAGEMGANLLTHLLGQTIESLAEKIALYHEALESAGHQRTDKTVTLMLHTFVWKDTSEAIEMCREPFKNYLRDHVSLESMAQSMGKEAGDNFESNVEEIIQLAFERYIYTASLIGSVDDCLKRVEKLKSQGVDEIACLIDFGVDAKQVLKSLGYLKQLKERSQSLHCIDQRALLSFLNQSLPNYMIPKLYIHLDTPPLTPNGKVDRKHLQSKVSNASMLQATAYAAPCTDLQRKLAVIWSENLKVYPIGIHDDFFERGGYSLLALQVIRVINQQFNIQLRVHNLFSAPTIAQFSSLLKKELFESSGNGEECSEFCKKTAAIEECAN